MTHVTRWRTITATASTAVLAAGAFGIAAAVERPSQDAERIEMTSEATVGGPVEDGTTTLDRSVQSTASADETASVSPVSEESTEEALDPDPATQGDAAAQVQPESPSVSPADDSPSPSPEEDSPSISPTEDSPSPSPEDDSPSISPADESPSPDEESPSVDDDEGSPDSAS